MPIIKACVVCGFRLPCVKRRDTRYCPPSCRARAGRARRLRRNLDALRVHHTALRWRLLAYWFVGLRARRGMRPLETEEMVERLAQIVNQLADAKHRAATLKAQLARLESGLLTANDAHHAEREALQAHLSAAEDEVERLQQELEAAAGVDEDEEEQIEEKGMHGNTATLLGSLEFRVMDLMAENERLKESATAHRSFRDAELYDALERAAAIEKEKANWDAVMQSLQRALSQQTDAATAAKKELSTRATLIVAATKKIQKLAARQSSQPEP